MVYFKELKKRKKEKIIGVESSRVKRKDKSKFEGEDTDGKKFIIYGD